ncbi:MAG: hypothetical protein ACREA9_25625 [Pyrinomonadaceae bacterium]
MKNETIVALAASCLSLVIAAISLGWNIFRDIVLKGRLKVYFGPRVLITHGSDHRPEYLFLSATNHGPGSLKLQSVVLLQTSWWRHLFRRKKHAFLVHDFTNPLSGKLPTKLEVGESIDLLFPYDKDAFLSGDWTRVGITDSFGRTHWATDASVNDACKRWREKFPAA